MSSQDKIKNLRDHLAYLLAQKEQAQKSFNEAESDYEHWKEVALQIARGSTPEYERVYSKADDNLAIADAKVSEFRGKVRQSLEDYAIFDSDPEKKPAPGFELRMERELVFDVPSMVKWAADSGLYFLLDIKKKELEKLIYAYAEKRKFLPDSEKEYWAIPESFRRCLPEYADSFGDTRQSCEIGTKMAARISDATLAKNVPDEQPETELDFNIVNEISF